MADIAFGEMETLRLNSSRKIRDALPNKTDDAISGRLGHEVFKKRSLLSLKRFVVHGQFSCDRCVKNTRSEVKL